MSVPEKKQTVDEAIEALEQKALDGESEGQEGQSEGQAEEPETVEVFGVTLRKDEWEKHREAFENQSRMVAAHTQRSQELAEERRKFQEEIESFRPHLEELDRVRQLAQKDPEAAVRYLAGESDDDDDDEPRTRKRARADSETTRRLERLEQERQAEKQASARAQLRKVIRDNASQDPYLKDDPDTYVDEIERRLYRKPGITAETWQSALKDVVSDVSSAAKKAEDRILEKHGLKSSKDGKRERAKKMSVPRAGNAATKAPEPESQRVTPHRGGRVDWDAVQKQAVNYEKELRSLGGGE